MMMIALPTGTSALARPLTAMARARLRLSAAFAAILLVALSAMLTPQPVALALQAAPSPQFAPPPPSTLTAQGDVASALLYWDALNDPSITSYQYRQKRADQDWSVWTDVPDMRKAGESISARIPDLDAGVVYQFQLRALNAVGPGPPSPTAVATPFKRTSAPTHVTIVADDDDATIAWRNGGNGVGGICPTLGYFVRVQDNQTGAVVAEVKIGNPGITSWYMNELLKPSTKYILRIQAYSSTQSTAWSWALDDDGCTPSDVSGVYHFATTATAATAPPPTPSNLTVDASIASVWLSWDISDDVPISRYQFRLRKGDDDWTVWIDINAFDAAATPSYVAVLDVGVTYQFQVRAVNAFSPGASSPTVSATPIKATSLPTDVTVIPGDDHATISWSTAVDGEDEDCPVLGYRAWIHQLTAQGEWELMDRSVFQDATTTSWYVDGLVPGTEYSISVQTDRDLSRGCTSFSLGPDFTTTGSSASALPAPSNLRAEAGVREATLYWDDPENQSIESYQYRQKRQDGVWGSWMNIDASDASTTSHTVTSLNPGIPYWFQLRAVGASRSGAASLTDAMPTEGIVTVVPGDDHATISWSVAVGGEDEDCPMLGGLARISQLATQGGWALLDLLEFRDTTTSWYVDGLIPATQYHIYVGFSSHGGVDCLPPSLSTYFTTTGSSASALPAPSNLRAEAGVREATLSWDDPENQSIESYQHRQKQQQDGVWGAWIDIDASDASTTSHKVASLDTGVRYWFQLRAVGASRPGAASLTDAVPTEGIVTVIPGDDHATISWSVADGGEDEDCPTLGGLAWISQLTAQGEWTQLDLLEFQDTTTSWYVDGLIPATQYHIDVGFSSHGGIDCVPPSLSTYFTTTGSSASALPAPSNLRAEAGVREATLSWDDPENQSIESYQYRQKRPDGVWGSWVDIDASDASTTSHKVASLDTGVRYWFQVRAVSAIGSGAAALTDAMPTEGIVTVVPGDDHAIISWSTVDSEEGENCPTIGYHVSIEHGTVLLDTSTIEDAATTNWYVDGLIPATEYSVSVQPHSNVGYSCSMHWLRTSFTTTGSAASTPPAPTNLRPGSSVSETMLYWDSPDDHAIEEYQYRQKRRYGIWEPWTDIDGSNASTTSHTLTSLSPGIPYLFQVRAVSAVGPGALSFLQVMSSDGDGSMKLGVPAGRIVARRLSDGRTELGYQPQGQDRILPAQRFFPAHAPLGRWIDSSDVLVPGVSVYGDAITEVIGRISARLLADGRIELAFTDNFGERMRPARRYFPASSDGQWLRSAPFGH